MRTAGSSGAGVGVDVVGIGFGSLQRGAGKVRLDDSLLLFDSESTLRAETGDEGVDIVQMGYARHSRLPDQIIDHGV